MEEPSERLVEQRIRTHLHEMLEWFLAFERDDSLGFYELINCWYDFWPDSPTEHLPPPVFTASELERLMIVEKEVMPSVKSGVVRRKKRKKL